MLILGLLFGAGVFVASLGLFGLVSRRSEYVKTIYARLKSHDFALKLNVALSVSIGSALITGVLFRDVMVIATCTGFITGWIFTHTYFAKRTRHDTLQLALSAATLAEDCAILCTTHLGLRQSLTLALSVSSAELQSRIGLVMDVTSDQQLLVHQLKELSRVERENALGRFARTLAMALERGNSPEASLIQLAGEIRNNARRDLLQLAAKKEIAMMVPVVFAVLPSVTAIALFPALKSLQHL